MISLQANLFDLHQKSVRYTPFGTGYNVELVPLSFRGSVPAIEAAPVLCGAAAAAPTKALTAKALGGARALSAAQLEQELKLPFAFPYGNKQWRALRASVNGAVSFGAASDGGGAAPCTAMAAAAASPGGTMRSVCAAMDMRSASGLEHIISVLWAPNDLQNS